MMTKKLYFSALLLLSLLICQPAFGPMDAWAESEQEELFSVAQRAFEDGFYDIAIRYANEFQEKYPKDGRLVKVGLLEGQCYYFKGEYPKAFDIFKELVQYSDSRDVTLFWLAESYLKRLDFAQAEKNYSQVIDVYPGSLYAPQAYYSLGWCYFEQRKFMVAKRTFKRLIAKYPLSQMNEDAILKIAECDFNAGSFKDAVGQFQAYLDKYPQTVHRAQVYFNIAESWYYQENYPQAILNYQKSIEISNDANMTIMALVSQSWSYLKLKKFTEAESVLNRAEQLGKEKDLLTDDVYLARANLYSEQGDYEKALEAYTELINRFAKSPRIKESYLGRANIYYTLKRYQEAINEYQAVIKIEAKTLASYDITQKAQFGLAWSYLKSGNFDQAIKSFEAVFNQTRDRAVKLSALSQIGDVYQDAGQLDKALEVYDRAIKEYPDGANLDYIQYRQAIALLKLDKVDAATLAFESLQANFPKSRYLEDVGYYLGVGYFKKNSWALTVKNIEAFLKNTQRPNEFTPEANYILGLSYLNLKQPDEALKIFQKILRLYPGDEVVAKNSDIGIAKCHFELGQIKDAVKKFKMIAFKYPGSEAEFEALFWLAQYFLKQSDYLLAQEYYKKLIDRFPESSQIQQIRYELGQAYEAQGAFDLALTQYQRITDEDKSVSAKSKLAIAGIFSKELDSEKAVSVYENIVATSPDYQRDAYLKMAQVYRSNQNYQMELEVYQKALLAVQGKGKVSDAELQFCIADTLESMDRPKEAIDAYLKIPYAYRSYLTWMIKAYLRVAKIFERLEDWEAAKVTYQKIIQLNVDEARYAQERLDLISAKLQQVK